MRKLLAFCLTAFLSGGAFADSLNSDLINYAHKYKFYGCDSAILKVFHLAIKNSKSSNTDWAVTAGGPDGYSNKIFNAWILWGGGKDVVKSQVTIVKTAKKCITITSSNIDLSGSCANNMQNVKIGGSTGSILYGQTSGGVYVTGRPEKNSCHLGYTQITNMYPRDK